MHLDRPTITVVDPNGLGLGIKDSLQRKYGQWVVKGGVTDSPTSKVERFGIALSYAYDGKVLLPQNAPWLEAWLYEMIAFPNGENDDQVDSFSQVVAYFERVIGLARQTLSLM